MSQSEALSSEPFTTHPPLGQRMLNKVPQVTIFFWIIKVLATTVGETAADFLNTQLNLGLTNTTYVMSALLALVLVFQFRAKRYVPAFYWLAVVLLSVVGTLITDNLVDNMKVPLQTTTLVMGFALTVTFIAWYVSERTLSIHSIFTTRREVFYWLTILFTFALGTAAGDLAAEALGLGYLVSAVLFGTIIAVIAVTNRFGLNSVLTFWAAYILTRPLGASLGDYLSQPPTLGGLGLGTIGTSALFLLIILGLVVYLSLSRRDVDSTPAAPGPQMSPQVAIWQTVGFIAIFAVLAGGGFAWRSQQLASQAATARLGNAPLGDLSVFRQIAGDTLSFVQAKDLAQAKARVTDLETAWDNDQAQLKPMSPEKWTEMDGAIDTVLKNLRAAQPNTATCQSALQALLTEINTLDPQPAATGG